MFDSTQVHQPIVDSIRKELNLDLSDEIGKYGPLLGTGLRALEGSNPS